MRRVGVILLAVWLILTGLLPLMRSPFPQAPLALALLAIAAGLLLLIDTRGRSIRNWAIWLLGIWLILQALIPLLKVSIPHSDVGLALLALAAGSLLILRREL